MNLENMENSPINGLITSETNKASSSSDLELHANENYVRKALIF